MNVQAKNIFLHSDCGTYETTVDYVGYWSESNWYGLQWCIYVGY